MMVTTPTGFYTYRGKLVPDYSIRNNTRLPDYFRMDAGTVFRLNNPQKTFGHFLTLSFYNVLFSKNYAFLYYNKIAGDDSKFYVPADTSIETEK
ncbi:MAG: hypothetical protein HC906_11895 [Bacteroidales bacterium]|nr:hypothetical protein [Bacteroidales bacterium]